MNILIVNWRDIRNPEMGGAEVHLHEIFSRIAKKGHKVTLVAHYFPGAQKEEILDGIKILRHGNKFLFDKQFKYFYKNVLSKENYDLIVDDISKIPLNLPKYANASTVAILHHIHADSLFKEIPYALALYVIHKEKQIPKNYQDTKIFTVSESTTAELVDLGFRKGNTAILNNAINHELFSGINVNKSESPLLTYIGRIKNYKNIDKIIDAVNIVKKKIPSIKLIIGGKGDCEDKLKEKVYKLKLENQVEFTGFLSEEEKAELLGKSWLFVSMAEKEGWGITVIEANAMKTPAIGSDVPGLRDSIKDGKTGFLVPLGDSVALAKRIEEVIGNKSELEQISKNAFEWSQKFSWDKSADYFLEKINEWYPQLNK